MKLHWYILIIITIVSCNKNKTISSDTILYGKIVNPLNNQLILSRNGLNIDTIVVQADGSFHFKFNQKEESLFFFKHGAEKQMLYAKPGDSIAFRLNTLSFDETLVFDAYSAAENNFLIDCFLLNEKNNEVILAYHKTSVEHFLKITDSLKNYQIKKLNQLKKAKELTPYFIEVAEKSINFEFYDMKERYAFLIQKYFSEKVEDLHKHDFFSYRNSINYNENKLFSHIGYLRFLDNYIKNKSIESCLTGVNDKQCFDLNTYNNLNKRIEITKNLFENNYLKSQFLKRFIRREIIQSKNEAQIKNAIRVLDDFFFTDEDQIYYRRLADFQTNFLIGKSLHEHNVYNHKFEEVTFNKITNGKPILIYLWSANSTSLHQKRLAKVKELRNRFPEVEFIGINIDFENRQLWERTLKQYKYDKRYEYQVLGNDGNRDLYENYLSKVFFVDAPTGIIQNSTDIMYSENLESTLLAFLNP